MNPKLLLSYSCRSLVRMLFWTGVLVCVTSIRLQAAAVVIEYNPATAGSDSWLTNGQSFTTDGAIIITRFAIRPTVTGSGIWTLYEGNGTSGTQLSTGSFNFTSANGSFKTWNISPFVTLAANTQYTMIWVSAISVLPKIGTFDGYSGGHRWGEATGAGVPSAVLGDDFPFKVHGFVATEAWSRLGSAHSNREFFAFAFDQSGNLYGGGDFTVAGGTNASHIAKWDGTDWTALGSGIGGYLRVDAIAWISVGEFGDRPYPQIGKFDFRAFRLYRNLTTADGCIKSVVDQVVVEPDFYLVVQRLNDQDIPFTGRILGIISQIDYASPFPLGDAPFFLGSAPFDHIWHGDVFDDHPEVSRILVHQLHFDGLWKHLVQRSGERRMDQHAAISSFIRESILHLKAIVGIDGVRNQVPFWLTKADQHSIANYEWIGVNRDGIHHRHIDMPSSEILAIEEVNGWRFFPASKHEKGKNIK